MVSTAPAIHIQSAGSALYGARAALPFAMERTNGSITIATDHGHLLLERAMAGTLDGDIVLLPQDMIEELDAGGLLLNGARIHIGKVGIGACVRAGIATPDVSDMQALARSIEEAEEVVLTEAPTGQHMLQMFERMGLDAIVRRKLVRFDKAAQCNAHIISSDTFALGFAPATEIIAWQDRGLAYCGLVPDEIQVALPYGGAILRASENPSAAREVLALLGSDACQGYFRDSGVEQ